MILSPRPQSPYSPLKTKGLWTSCSSKVPQEWPIKLFIESRAFLVGSSELLHIHLPSHYQRPLVVQSALAQQPHILVPVFSINCFSSYSYQMPDKGDLKMETSVMAGNV